eukprot:8923009-Pyramimonas_sp.AAC.1
MGPSGVAQTNLDDMVAVLRAHWKSVFWGRGHSSDLLCTWAEEDQAARPAERPLQGLPVQVRLRRRHVRRALKLTGNAAPSPDGIPFKVRRLFDDFAVDLSF